MGIRGLSSYVRHNGLLSNSELSNTSVIIDGSNICYYLYNGRYDASFPGSDYSLLARNCRRYFQALKQYGIKAYVVFDGGNNKDYRHFRTTLKRKQNIINDYKNGEYRRMPALGKATFLQILDELDIPHASTIFEADTDIAVLANKWGCPVMSNDSDFFIYQLEEGCIPFPCINATTQLENKTIPIQLYQYRKFITEKQTSADMLPFMATIMGNDYVDRTILLQLFRKMHWFNHYNRPEDILTWLNTFRDSPNPRANVLETVLRGEDATADNEETFNHAIDEYQLDEFSAFDLDTFFRTNSFIGATLDDYYGNRLPAWFVQGLLSCNVSSSFLQDVFVLHRVIFTCQAENIDLPSSFACSRYIRQCIYGIAVAPASPANLDIFFVEHDRKEDRCWPFVVKPLRELPKVGMLPDIWTISEMPKNERQRLFLACFNVEPRDFQGFNMNDAVVPLILSLSYWMKHAQPEVNMKQMDALLMCVIYLHLKSLVFKEDRRNMSASILEACSEVGEGGMNTIEKAMYIKYDQQPNEGWDKNIVHGFSQFYSCCIDTSRLNQVMNIPFRIASPIVAFNSKFAYNFYTDLVTTGLPAEDISGFKQYSKILRLFTTLRKVVHILVTKN